MFDWFVQENPLDVLGMEYKWSNNSPFLVIIFIPESRGMDIDATEWQNQGVRLIDTIQRKRRKEQYR
jgi:hypothetical protein